MADVPGQPISRQSDSMNRPGRALLGCLLLSTLLAPALAPAGDNSLLVPAIGRCSLTTVPEALAEALQACNRAAEQGDAEAQFELGEYYYHGKQGEPDRTQALHWYEQASLQGHALAQHRLGSMFFRGEGVQPNNVQAYIVLKMAAVNGADEALDTADQVSEQMAPDQLDIALQVLGQIFRSYMQDQQDTQDAEQQP
jgi:TPR repeat protein